MVDLVIEDYPKLFGEFLGSQTKATREEMWTQIAKSVNAVGTAKKTGDKWKKVSEAVGQNTASEVAKAGVSVCVCHSHGCSGEPLQLC